MTEVHVVPDERTATWRVYDPEADAELSEHASATEAQFTAQARAADCDAERVVVHDRYHRTHETTPAPFILPIAAIEGPGMETEEPRQRREALATLASVRLRGAGARRSSDARLRREILDAFARQRAGQLGEDHAPGVQPNPVPPLDAQR